MQKFIKLISLQTHIDMNNMKVICFGKNFNNDNERNALFLKYYNKINEDK